MKIKTFKPNQAQLYSIENWESYNLANSKEEFIALLINLQEYGATLEELKEGFTDCGFCLTQGVENIASAVINHTIIFDSVDKYIEVVKDNYDYEEIDYSFEEYLQEDMTCDAFVVEYENKIYKRVFV